MDSLRARGLLFAGSQIITETWQERIKRTYYPKENWTAETRWWILKRLDVIDVLSSQAGEPGGGGGGGGGDWGKPNKGPKAVRPSDEKVQDCLEQVFDIILGPWSYTWKVNKDGATGNFSLTALESADFTVAQISSSTNFSKDSRSLAQQYNSENRGRFTMQSGYTSSTNKKVNWIASDVITGTVNRTFREIAVEALFFHETGNMIANLLRQGINSGNSSDPTGDRDKGQQLENCLYGGRVGLRTGRLGNNREL